jgi:hypothetical protein
LIEINGDSGAMLLVPAVGIALQFARGYALPIFGLAEILRCGSPPKR